MLQKIKTENLSSVPKEDVLVAECSQHAPKKGGSVTRSPRKKRVNLITLEKCKTVALEFHTRTSFQQAEPLVYKTAKENGWLEECYAHMRKKGEWTLEECILSAEKYKTLSQWERGAGGSFRFAKKKGWTSKCTAHMIVKVSWTKELCMESSAGFLTKSDWRCAIPGAYQQAYIQGWMKECCKHMPKPAERRFN